MAAVPTSNLRDARSLLGTLASREIGSRYRLRRPEREVLLGILGPLNAKRAFVLATLIDEQFTRFPDDYAEVFQRNPAMRVVPASAAFLRHISNPAPMLGQMTSIAVCRRWWHRFWLIGRTERIEGFGPFPKPRRVPLPARTLLALEQAVDEQEFRVVMVTWRRHRSEDLVKVHPHPGCFAVTGRTAAAPDALLSSVLTACSDRRAHLAVLPELALEVSELQNLIESLKDRRTRYPALIAAGLMHAERGGSYFNEAVLLDASGNELLRHEKLEPYTDDSLGIEAIGPRQAAQYDFVDTPVGRIVLNICRDVRSDVPMLLNRLLGATVLVVPAYSRELKFVLEEARVLGARQSAMTFAVNPTGEGLKHAACTYVPVRGVAKSERLVLQDGLPVGGQASLVTVRIQCTGDGGLLEGPQIE